MNGIEKDSKSSPRVPLGGDYWDADSDDPLWGFADTHAHLMAHLAFGGEAFWGEPYDPNHSGDEALDMLCALANQSMVDLSTSIRN